MGSYGIGTASFFQLHQALCVALPIMQLCVYKHNGCILHSAYRHFSILEKHNASFLNLSQVRLSYKVATEDDRSET